MPEVWENADDVKALAVDLTMKQLEREGEAVERSDIESLVDDIPNPVVKRLVPARG